MSAPSVQLGEILSCGAPSQASVGLRRISSKHCFNVVMSHCHEVTNYGRVRNCERRVMHHGIFFVIEFLPYSAASFANVLYRYHPYKIDRRHELQPGDYAQRLEHCQMVVNETDDQLFSWLTSDEAGFELHGKVNTHNVRRYSEMGQGRPEHFVQEKPTVSPKLMVFCGLRKDGTFGLKFWRSPDTITGQVYHSLLQYHVLPEIRALNGGNLDK